MEILKILLVSFILMLIIMLGMGIKLFFKKETSIKPGCCGNTFDSKDGSIGCACSNEITEKQK